MPSPQEVVGVTTLAIEGMSKVGAAAAEKLTLDLPEIFGSGKAANISKILEKAPEDLSGIAQTAHNYQRLLTKFDLPRNATPNDLFDAAARSGRDFHRIDGARGRNYHTSTNTMGLGEGCNLTETKAYGRSLGFRTVQFSAKEMDSKISFTSGHSMRRAYTEWSVSGPNMRETFRTRLDELTK